MPDQNTQTNTTTPTQALSQSDLLALLERAYIIGEAQGRRNMANIERTTFPEVRPVHGAKWTAQELLLANAEDYHGAKRSC